MPQKSGFSLNRHSLEREPPLPLYLGMKVYSVFRSKDLALQSAIENEVVYPSNIVKNILTVCGFDNVDHNPSSTFSQGSFHGTAITTIQNQVNGFETPQTQMKFAWPEKFLNLQLPDAYIIVPDMMLNVSSSEVPQINSFPRKSCDSINGSARNAHS
eukprot:Pompholyxophrys_punicea_v1_NODE_1017_length_1040_cov_2.193909.p1 type:complete len:157 gc:universal NODE_1017_length_1040_cov_2.193909:322-792(+)